MGLKLSIVVPVYKVEQYLSKCVESLINQDLSPEEYEIILVDDGSPDRCGEICDDYALRYPNIKVVHRENGGLSAARNIGIDVSHGKYIQFVDSDDYLEPNVLGGLIQKMESEALDMLRFDYQNVNESYQIFYPFKDPKRFMDYKDKICDGATFLNERLGPACYAVQFIIRTSLLESERNRFKLGVYFEDTEWLPRVLIQAQRVTSINSVVYYYLVRRGSITQSIEEEKKDKIMNDKILLIDSMLEQMSNIDDKRWFESMITMSVLSIMDILSHRPRKKKTEVLELLRKKAVYPLTTFHILPSFHWRIKIINVSPSLYCMLLSLKKR